jgi:transposase-like protein
MVARLLCSNAKAGARLTLNTDRLSTGNNVIECDHGKLKRIIGATLGFKSMKTAYATIKGIEVMRALRKGRPQHFIMVIPGRNAPGKQSF